MVARAEAKYVRISPFKVKLVVDIIKGLATTRAMSILQNTNQKAAYHLKKVLKSAVSNAKNKGYEEDKLFISKIVANPGPVLKRYRSATFGRATMVRKRTAHLIVELDSPEKVIAEAKIK